MVDEPVSLIDLLPTFQDIAEVPEAHRLPVDGKSLMGLLRGTESQSREVIAENHAEGGVEAPTFMLGRRDFKYIHIHGHRGQLFNLADDPDEWQNVAGHPDYVDIERELRNDLLERFDPEAIEAQVHASYHKRMMIDRAMKLNDTHWDHEPRFDPRKDLTDQYLY